MKRKKTTSEIKKTLKPKQQADICRIVVKKYDDDKDDEDVHAAMWRRSTTTEIVLSISEKISEKIESKKSRRRMSSKAHLLAGPRE